MKIPRRQLQVSVPSVAMGDIAFNLLVFFVILARAQDDSHVQWLPAKTDKVESAGHSKVSIVIDTQNDIYLNGRHVGVGELTSAVEALLGDLPPGQRNVVLKIHKDATALYFEPVIEAVSEAGGDLIHILEKETRKGG